MYEMLLNQYKKKWGVTECNQMMWLQEMNNIEKCIDEVIKDKIIFR